MMLFCLWIGATWLGYCGARSQAAKEQVMNKLPERDCYAVARISDGAIIYCGWSLTCAAIALEPGTCSGIGMDRDAAKLAAEVLAREFRERDLANTAALAKAGSKT